MPRKYNRSHCSSSVRAVVTDKFGNTITLMGKHAFEWSILKESNGTIYITSFPSRKEAMKEFNTYKRKR